MTKQEMLDMIAKLQEQANSMPDDGGNTEETAQGEPTENPVNKDPKTGDDGEPEANTDGGEVEEAAQIEPQTNGKITDDVTPEVDSTFEQSTNASETTGVEQVLSANLDQRFATMATDIGKLKAELDKTKVVLSEILTRIELVQEVTDKVTTVDHDTLLSESIKLLI